MISGPANASNMRAREMGMTSHSNNFNTRLQIAGAINIVFQRAAPGAGTEKKICSKKA